MTVSTPPLAGAAARRIGVTLFLAQSLTSASFIAMFSLTAIVAARLSGSDDLAGWPATVGLLGRAALAFPIGWVMDRIGRRFGLSIGYFVGGAGALITVFAIIRADFWLMLFGSVLLGMARSAAEQAPYIAAEVQPAAKRARAIGSIVFAGTVGAVFGPLSTAPSESVALALGLPAEAGPWGLGMLLFLLAVALIVIFLRPDPLTLGRQMTADESAANSTPTDNTLRPLRAILTQPMVLLAIASMAIGQLVMTMLMVITPLYMAYCGHPTSYISWAVMAHTLGMFGLSGVTGWLIDKTSRITMMIAGALLLVLSGLLAPIANPMPIVTILMFVLGLGWNFCHIAGASLLSDQLRSTERGRVQGTSEMFVALSSGIGSFASGYLFSRLGYSGVGFVGIAISTALVIIVGLVLLTQRPPTAPQPA